MRYLTNLSLFGCLFLLGCGQPPSLDINATFVINAADLANFFTAQCQNSLPPGYTQDQLDTCVNNDVNGLLASLQKS